MSEREKFYKEKLQDYPAYQASIEVDNFIIGRDALTLSYIAFVEGQLQIYKELRLNMDQYFPAELVKRINQDKNNLKNMLKP